MRVLHDSDKKELTELPAGAVVSYSQEGEDLVLQRFMETTVKQKGFYVDIGAHHPTRFSNTYYFYLQGWNGLNVDATPGSMQPFEKLRPRDINVEMGIAASEGELKYYLFNEPALNTFDQARRDFLVNDTPFKLIQTVTVKTKTLAQILNEYLPENTEIDFMSVDVEELDYDILVTNDWNKYKPTFLLIEDIKGELENFTDSNFYKLLSPKGYRLVAKTHNTLFFKFSK